MKLLKNPFFHGAVLLAMALIMIVEVVARGANSLAEMTIIGKVAGYIFIADLLGFVFYVVVLRMIFKVK